MNRTKKVILQFDLIDGGIVVFKANIPYEVDGKSIENGHGLALSITEIWVDFKVVFSN